MKTRKLSFTFIVICSIALLPLCAAAASATHLSTDTVLPNSSKQKHVRLKDVQVQGTSAVRKVKQQGYAVDAISIKPQQNKFTTLKEIVDRSAKADWVPTTTCLSAAYRATPSDTSSTASPWRRGAKA